MRKHRTIRTMSLILAAGGLTTATGSAPALADDVDTIFQEMTVTGTREAEPKAETPASVGSIDSATIDSTKANHPGEVIGRIPGAHVAVTNGEGSMAAIRQPITTGSVYLFLEDGVPTRSTGFFNHNGLYEINVPQSGGLEVLKGPGSALQGSDAIGGVVNVLTRAPSQVPEAEGSLEWGSYGWMRGLASGSGTWGDDGFRIDANLTETGGWRNATNYGRQSGTLRWDHVFEDGASLKTVFTASNIDQQTAGNSKISRTDWNQDPTVNYTPISYREVKAVRLSAAYEREDADSLLSVTPYLRWNTMEYLANWSLSYDASILSSGHSSAGVMAKYRQDFEPWRTRVIGGLDLDYSPGSHEETDIDAKKVGSTYVSYTVNGAIYDYDVTYMAASPYLHAETSPFDNLRLSGGLRFDAMRFEYDNKLSDSVTGSGFGTRNRQPDNTVNFLHLSPKLGATYAFSPNYSVYGSYKHAFRAPSESSLFRSGRNLDSLHLDPVKVDSYEIGLRAKPVKDLTLDLAAYYMTKKDDIVSFTAADGSRTVTNAGETLHKGIEAGLGYRLTDEWRTDLALSFAEHTYEDWSPTNTTSYDGNQMESAPGFLGNATVEYKPSFLPGTRFELEWTAVGGYKMDAANTPGHEYEGHNLFNLRGSYDITDSVTLSGRVMNLLDSQYATLAAYSTSRGDEYAPGMPLTAYVTLEAKF